MKDIVGREISVGCDVVYPVRRGSVMNMHRMNVTSTESGKLRGFNSEGRPIRLDNLSNVVVVVPVEVPA